LWFRASHLRPTHWHRYPSPDFSLEIQQTITTWNSIYWPLTEAYPHPDQTTTNGAIAVFFLHTRNSLL